MALDAAFDSSPFTTAIVLYSLTFVYPATTSSEVYPGFRQRALDFLHSERIEPGIWRYWSAASGKGISPDLDDTALVSFVLQEHGQGGDLKPANRDLILSNRNREGIFYTWLRSQGAKNDLDSVVNSNVLLYLGDCPETAGAASYLCDLISTDQVAGSFWYYTTELALDYAVSRAIYHGVHSLRAAIPALYRRLLDRRLEDGSWGDELATGLALSALFNLSAVTGEPLLPAIRNGGVDFLLSRQEDSGAWRSIAYYQGPEPPAPRTRFFGSRELTTAVCLEALARHDATG